MGSVLCCKEANSLEEGDGKRAEQRENGIGKIGALHRWQQPRPLHAELEKEWLLEDALPLTMRSLTLSCSGV